MEGHARFLGLGLGVVGHREAWKVFRVRLRLRGCWA